ncbi:WD40 repeat-like protein [Lepidopterella palustris CBS 459.81]|uniref:WD40 repeat-like protein n=1 Tax=Lepidopterella palustris CBS 459.81 TaxID=1314670 RepID=A0A8E2JCK9_9PEZI|nr:WD40 repeat-like protein [Lepidopterella palustris CBS 459.81]
MDIHRSRFVPYPPSAINAIAFSHSSNDQYTGEDPSCLRLAIGRANGNIEIWNPAKGTWIHERTFSGGKDRSVEGLAWIQEPKEDGAQENQLAGQLRLFSIGYSSSVTEWDLVTGLPLRHSSGNHSEVWCLAAQPQWLLPQKKKNGKQAHSVNGGEFRGQNLVVGCADGTLAILSTAEGDLKFQKYLARPTAKKARVLSVTYQNRDTVVAGFADSAIRVFDARTGQVIRNISLGAGSAGGPKETLVWKVKCLPNGDIVSGDSMGEVRFYDGKNYSQFQRISGHEADILDLAVGRDGRFVYSGGMDRRTTLYKRLDASGGSRGNGHGNWGKVTHQRYHDHDVKAMATYEGRALSVVVSGGIDTRPIVVPIRQFGKEHNRALPALPQCPALASAPGPRLVISWWNSEVRVWRVKSRTGIEETPKVVARMALRGEEHIASASVSNDGSVIAIATAAGVKIFQLTKRQALAEDGLRIRKLECPSVHSARLVQFSADGKWLAIITHTQDVLLARLTRTADERAKIKIVPQLVTLRRLSRSPGQYDSLNGEWGNYYRTITHAQFSGDSNVLAVGDLAGYIDTWVLEGLEDSTAPIVDVGYIASSSSSSGSEESDNEEPRVTGPITIMGQRWKRNPFAHLIPKLDSAPLVMSFRPASLVKVRPQPNGNPAVHPTRHNPHPCSHDLPEGEFRLVVVSAQHQIYEFEVLNGCLSEWSRRNPTSNFPSSFKMIKDRAKGCVWDTHDQQQRLWLYGATWLFMFDLSQDFPLPGLTSGGSIANQLPINDQGRSRKRKRELEAHIPMNKNSGAGDLIEETRRLGPGQKIRKFTGGKADESTWIDLNARLTPVSEEELKDEHISLPSLRRALQQDADGDTDSEDDEHQKMANDSEDAPDGKDSQAEDMKLVRKSKKDVAVKARGPSDIYWHTFKYRPILGIVPIGDQSRPLEVVLVERPEWDLDLPPRFMGNHERNE